MKVIKIDHSHQFNKTDFPPLAIALGFFDGVHKGHQEVIQTAIKIAKEKSLNSAVMTFDPHPSVVLGNQTSAQYITPIEDKTKLMNNLDVDYLFIVHFTPLFSNLLPEEFVKQYLLAFNVRHVVAGFDFTYGRFGKGNMDTLAAQGKNCFEVTVIPRVENNGGKVSSTAIRTLINNGEMEAIQDLLGRFWVTKGTVVKGEQRGRTIGFPTANIKLDGDYITPKIGVYVVRIFVQNKWKYGVCNVGVKPTFHDPNKSELTIEVFILDFDQSIYGETVWLEWHKRLRDEKKFNGIAELTAQISQDVENTKQYFISFREA